MPLVVPHLYVPTGGLANTSRYTTDDHADFAPPAATSTFDIRGEITAWNSGTQRTVWGQWIGGGQASYLLVVGAVAWDRIRFYWSNDGSTVLSADSTVAIPNLRHGDRLQLRCLFLADDGASGYTADFYYKINQTSDLTSDTGWTALGTQVTGTNTTIFNSTAEVAVGRYEGGASDQSIIEVHQVALKKAGVTSMWADFRSGTWEPRGTDAQGHIWVARDYAQHRTPLLINTDKNHSAATASITCTFPQATTAGNLLLAAAFGRGNVHNISTAGWTKAIDIQDVPNDDTLELWYKTATGAETTVVFDVEEFETGTDLLFIGEYPGAYTLLDNTGSAGPTTNPVSQSIDTTTSVIEQVVFAAISQGSVDAAVTYWSTDEFVPDLNESNNAGVTSTLHVATQQAGRIYSFNGPQGAVWPTADWKDESDVPNGGGIDLQLGPARLYMQSNAGGSAAGGRAAALIPRIQDGEVTGLIENGGASSTNLVFYLRASGDWTGGDVPQHGYGVHFIDNSTNWQLYKTVSGTQTALGAVQNRVDQTPHRFRFQVTGTTVRCRAWKDGTAEPGTWDVSVTDTDITLPGRFTVSTWGLRDNVLREAWIYELTVENQSAMSTTGTFQATLTGGFSLGAIASFKAPAVTAPILENTFAGFNAGGTPTYTINKPPGTIEGELLVVHIVGSSSTGPITAYPAGWTEHANQANNDYNFWVGSKIVGASEPASWDWTFGNNNFAAHQIDRLSGAAAPEAVNVQAVGATNNASPSLTTLGTERLLLVYAGEDLSSAETWSIDSGIERVDETLGGEFLHIGGYVDDAPTAGVYTRTVTTTATSQDLHGVMLSIPPPSAGPVIVWANEVHVGEG